MIHDHFSSGGRFFRDDDDKVYLMWQHNIYEVSTNRPFNALIKRKTGLLPTEQPGRSVWESLASEGYNSGRKIDLGGWLHTDRGTDTVFLNLNSPNNIIIKITPAGIEEIQNGLNQDHILLQSSGKIKPFNYLPETTIEEAVSELRKLLFDNLSCETTQKYLLLCWFISTFVSDFSPHVAPLLKAAGETASGKTTAARLLEYLLYGDEHLGEISVAGAYADASQNPMLVIDNLENQDIKQEMLKFLLLVATRGSKVKRKGGTESGVTEESPKALVMVTAIEPFVKSELINRTFEVSFAKQYHNEGFIDDEVTRQILKKRDIILSGLLKLIQKEILPNLKKRTAYITALNVDHKGHSKERMNAYLALMMLILDRMLIYWDVKQHLKASDIWHTWIITQDQLAKEHEVSSNDILRLLDGLIREYRLRMNEQELKPHRVYGYEEEVYQYTHPEYGITITRTLPKFIDDNKEHTESFIEFEATSKDLTYAFTRFCKNNGLANPYSSAAIFGSRLKNDRKLLAKGGWELVTKEENGTYFKVVRGPKISQVPAPSYQVAMERCLASAGRISFSSTQCRIMFSKGCSTLMERVRGASPGCRCKLKSKNPASVMGLFSPIKQEGKFMEHFLSTYDPCTTFFINIFYFNGLERVQSGCRFGCFDGAAVVQVPVGKLTCTTTKQHNYIVIESGCKGAGR